MVAPETREEIYEQVLSAGRSALEHLAEVELALEFNLAHAVQALLATVAPVGAAAGLERCGKVKRQSAIARSRASVFWKGVADLGITIDVDRELRPWKRLVESVDSMTPGRVTMGLGTRALRGHCQESRTRLGEVMEQLEHGSPH